MSEDQLELWNSFDYYHDVNHFAFLTGQRGKFFGKDKKFYTGEYLFTVDWCHPDTNLTMVISLLNQITEYYGTLIRLQRKKENGQITKSKQHIGT